MVATQTIWGRPLNASESPEEWLKRIETLRRAVDLRLDDEGRWWHEGQRFKHLRLIEAFNAGIDLHPQTDEPIIRIGDRWCYFTADDTPFIVVKLYEDDGGLLARLNTGETLKLPKRSLFLRTDRLYANLTPKRWALFSRPAQANLEPWLQQGSNGQYYLETPSGDWTIIQETPTQTRTP